MTIREFYEWAVEHDAEDLDFGISMFGQAEEICEDIGIDPCKEVGGPLWLEKRRLLGKWQKGA